MFKKDTTDEEIRLGAFVEGTLNHDRQRHQPGHPGREAGSLELLAAVRRAMASDEDASPGEVPGHLVRRAMDMFRKRPGFVQITLALLGKAVEVWDCPDDVTVLRPGFAGGIRTGDPNADSHLIVIAKLFDSMNVELEADRGATGDGCTIRISVTPLQAGCRPDRLRVMLASRDRELFSGPLENGRITFEDVHPGIYRVLISNKGKTVGEIGLKLAAEITGGGSCGE